MKAFYSETHQQDNPQFEVFDGGVRMPYMENPDRMERIRSALQKLAWIDLLALEEFGLDPILAVHDVDYVDFLRTAHEEWIRRGDESQQPGVLPATFPPRGCSRKPDSILGRTGYYTFDLSAPIMAGTYQAALSAVNCALGGAKAIAAGEKATFALCRPPGHHAGKSFSGGYCYVNNAAVAANWLSQSGKIALLDIDYHAGNGTQNIFYERGDVLSISIHADPSWEYPYFSGYADETGAGEGLDLQRNYPLPAGTGDAEYLSALENALSVIQSYGADYLVLSAGMDIYAADPMGTFGITRDGIREIGTAIANLGIPALILTEGGYANEMLGDNFIALLKPFSGLRL